MKKQLLHPVSSVLAMVRLEPKHRDDDENAMTPPSKQCSQWSARNTQRGVRQGFRQLGGE